MTNPFAGADLGFSVADFAAAFERLPNLFNRVASLFTDKPISSTTAVVERKNGTLNIVASRERGAPADKVTADKRDLRAILVPHIPVADVVLPGEIQDVRRFGSEGAQNNAAVVAEKQMKMRRVLDQTREHLACGALKGIILDADGSTLLNLYTEFGITSASNPGDVGKYLELDFVLDNNATIVRSKCLAVKRHIEKNLRGESVTGYRALCSSTFYDALTTHPEVERAFEAYMALNQNLADDYRRGFRYGGIVFEEYMGSWTDKDGNSRAGITADKAIVFPEGTADVFKTIIAPGNFMGSANSMGQPYYAKMEAKKFDQGYDLWAESNVLPICLRPELLVTVSI